MIPVAIIGGGPAGLMAAEQLTDAGVSVALFDAMPSLGRKLLLAGIGGLNLTHSEPTSAFNARYEPPQATLQAALASFSADALRAWAQTLGIDTFVGSSGRVFPREMKAAPLLRRWLSRLRSRGLQIFTRHRCIAITALASPANGYELVFQTTLGEQRICARAVIFALGGGSWARLGSDGAWQQWLAPLALSMRPLKPANCGFHCQHSANTQALAGSPLKNITLSIVGETTASPVRGEAIITAWGIEGGLIYAHSAPIRERILSSGQAEVVIDLVPDQPAPVLLAALQRANQKHSLSRQWQGVGLSGIKAALVRDRLAKAQWADAAQVVATAKALRLRLTQARPIDEAISTAGGIAWSSLSPRLEGAQLPGLFFAGEMLDWEAPTGGYLLTACFATGRLAGRAALSFLTDDL